MKAANPHPKSPKVQKRVATWPRIVERVYDARQDGTATKVYQITYKENGKRKRETFNTIADAELRAVQLRNQRDAEGAAAFNVSMDVRIEAAKCIAKLQPFNAALTEATDYYIDRHLRFLKSPTISEGIEKLLDRKIKAGRSKRTVDNLRHRWHTFGRQFGSRKFSDVEAKEITDWLFKVASDPETMHNYRRSIVELFNLAVSDKWCKENPARDSEKPSRLPAKRAIFTVEQIALLLENSDQFDLTPYIVIGAFAGLRVSEIERLDWSKVKLSSRSIIAEAATVKTRTRRTVALNDTALAWLTPYIKKSGPVVNVEGLRERLLELRQAAGIKVWSHNGLRHSFGSYAAAAWKDFARVAYEMGNSIEEIKKHYLELVEESDAKRFWNLRPADASEKIVTMPKAANG